MKRPAAMIGFSLAALTLLLGAAAPPHPLAIVGATVHPMTGEPIAGATVLVVDGKITGIGERLTIPAGAERVDATGKHLFPGFIDADSVLGLTEVGSVRGTVDVREAGSVNPSLRPELAINPDSELIPVARANGVLHVRVAARGGLIDGTSALIRLDGWTWHDLVAAAPVALQVEWPSLRIDRRPEARVRPKVQQERIDERIRTLKEAFTTARAYLKGRDAAAAGQGPAVPADARWEEMRPALERKIPVVVEANDLEQIEAAIAWSDAEGVRMILSGGSDAWRAAEKLAAKEIPVILGASLALPARSWEPYDTAYANAAKLHAAGVKVCISTGGDGFEAANTRNLPYQAAMAEAFGLPHEEALRAITRYPAEILGVSDRLGTIEEGRSASLILTDGDPLDIRTQVLRAWVDGRELDLTSRHTRLYERYKSRP
jgi:imidazolonepropionase-like amidohydrolase